jgi:hypothetical protein
MSFSRLVFPAIKPLSVLSIALAAAVIGGCNERDVEPRAERGVVAKIFALQSRDDGEFVVNGTTEWKRPGATTAQVEAQGTPQVDITTCDFDYQTLDSDTTDSKSYVPGPTLDSLCYVTAFGSESTADDCQINTGSTRYTSMLGGFTVNLINNSTRKTQHMSFEGMGINIRIVNAEGAEVWNMEQDNLDYQDLVAEAANLYAAEGGDACRGKIFARSDSQSLASSSYFGTAGDPILFDLTPGNSQDFSRRFSWNGKDSEGNDVPAGTYTAHIDITVTDTDTGDTWESPAPIEFTIADADPETE